MRYEGLSSMLNGKDALPTVYTCLLYILIHMWMVKHSCVS